MLPSRDLWKAGSRPSLLHTLPYCTDYSSFPFFSHSVSFRVSLRCLLYLSKAEDFPVSLSTCSPGGTGTLQSNQNFPCGSLKALHLTVDAWRESGSKFHMLLSSLCLYHVFHLRPTALFFLELCEVSVTPLLHSLHSLSVLVSALSLTSAALPVVWGKLLSFNTISSSSSASLRLPLWCRERKTREGKNNMWFKAKPW